METTTKKVLATAKAFKEIAVKSAEALWYFGEAIAEAIAGGEVSKSDLARELVKAKTFGTLGSAKVAIAQATKCYNTYTTANAAGSWTLEEARKGKTKKETEVSFRFTEKKMFDQLVKNGWSKAEAKRIAGTLCTK